MAKTLGHTHTTHHNANDVAAPPLGVRVARYRSHGSLKLASGGAERSHL
ncbi:hypothetical protein [Rubritalea tangerina]|uniref:Uncharacterized protein n=1 Tax=Rubritalea tangerina TaxID=430798 RepID=A0ABW4ZB93_9BACT